MTLTIFLITFQTLDIVENDQVDGEQRREFELSDVLDYIKTGVEAIIEDQVTSRFEAQELRVNIFCHLVLMIDSN